MFCVTWWIVVSGLMKQDPQTNTNSTNKFIDALLHDA
jgi:hypothetical protein